MKKSTFTSIIVEIFNNALMTQSDKKQQKYKIHLSVLIDVSTYCELGFSSKIEIPKLGSTQLGKFLLELITSK